MLHRWGGLQSQSGSALLTALSTAPSAALCLSTAHLLSSAEVQEAEEEALASSPPTP